MSLEELGRLINLEKQKQDEEPEKESDTKSDLITMRNLGLTDMELYKQESEDLAHLVVELAHLVKQLWDMEDKLASLGHPWGDEEEHVSSTPDEIDENPMEPKGFN